MKKSTKIILAISIVAIVIGFGYYYLYQQPVLAHWTMDNYTTTYIVDDSGNGHNALFKGNMTTTNIINGKKGEAVYFNGEGNYLDCGHIDLANNKFVIDMWVNPSSTGQLNKGIVAMTGDPFYSSPGLWTFQIRWKTETDYLGLQIHTDKGIFWVTLTESVPANQWSHVVATYDNSSMSISLNGNKVVTLLDDTTLITSPTHELYIATDGWANYYKGSVDELKISG